MHSLGAAGRSGIGWGNPLDLIVHLLRLDVGLLEKIGQPADREDAGDGPRHTRREDVSVDETGRDPSPKTKGTADEIANGATQAATLGAFLQLTRATFSFDLGKGRAKGGCHLILGDDATEFLRCNRKERDVLRLDPFGQWFLRAFAGKERGREQGVEDRDQGGVISRRQILSFPCAPAALAFFFRFFRAAAFDRSCSSRGHLVLDSDAVAAIAGEK